MPWTLDETGALDAQGVAALPYLAVIVGYIAFCVWVGLCVNVKRCHDRGRSGWFMLVQLIPVVGGIWYVVEAAFLRGTAGPNRFGPDPIRDPAALVTAPA